MADKGIDIRLRASGGKAAAKEVEAVAEAVEAVGAAAEESAKEVEAVAEAVEAVGAAAEDAAEEALPDAGGAMGDLGDAGGALGDVLGDVIGGGQGGGLRGLGASLLRLAGGPIGIATAAVGGLVSWYGRLSASIAATLATSEDYARAARATSDAIAEMTDPVSETVVALNGYRDAVGGIADGAEAAVAGIAARATAMDDEATAARGLRDALDELAVAEGRMTEDERAAKQADDAVADRREDDAAAVAAAQARSAEIAAAQAAAMGEVLAARQRLAEIERAAAASQAEAAEASRAFLAEAARAQSELDRAAQDGPDLALAMRRGGATGPLGAAADYVLQKREQAEAVRLLAEERDKLQASADAILAGENENAAKRAPELDAAREALEKANAALERLRELGGEAAADHAAALTRQRRGEQFDIPAIQTRQRAEQARAQQQREEREQREREKREREEARRREEAARAAADEEARRIAADAARAAAAGRGAGADATTVRALDSAAAKLADGTNLGELSGSILRLSAAAENLAEQERATVLDLINRMRATEQKLEQLAAQARNNPNRG